MSYKSNAKQRLLTVLLTVAMIFAMLPAMSAFADELPTPEATASFSNSTTTVDGIYDDIKLDFEQKRVAVSVSQVNIVNGKSYAVVTFASKGILAYSVNVDGVQQTIRTETEEPSANFDKGKATAEMPIPIGQQFEFSAYSKGMNKWIKYSMKVSLERTYYVFIIGAVKVDNNGLREEVSPQANIKITDAQDGTAIEPYSKNGNEYTYRLTKEAVFSMSLGDEYEQAGTIDGKYYTKGNSVITDRISAKNDYNIYTGYFMKKENAPAPKTLEKGVYNVTGDPKKTDDAGIANTYGSKMFRVVKATLTIADNGKPVFADIYLSGVGYDALYVGKMVKDAPAGAIAAGNPDKLYTSAQLPKSQTFVGKDDAGKLHFVIPVSEFDEAFDLLARSTRFDQWSHKKLSFAKDKLVKISGLDPEYNVLEGKEIDLKQGDTATIRVDAEYSNFHEVLIDGEVLDSTKYTSKSGSTIVSINTSGLAVGRHTVTMTFANGRYATSTINLAQGPAVNPANSANPANPGQPAVNPAQPAQPANPAQPGSTQAVAGSQAQGQTASGKATPNTGDASDMQLMTLVLLASLTSAVAVYRKKSAR